MNYLVAGLVVAIVALGVGDMLQSQRIEELEMYLNRTKQEVCHLQIGHPPDYGEACLQYLQPEGVTK